MGQAKRRGTHAERVAQAMQSKEPEQFFGYDRERRPDESPFEFSDDGLVCMVSSITGQNLDFARQETGKDYKLGDWFCSVGAHDDTVIHGPFENSEIAFNFAYENLSVVRFISAPQFGF